MCSTCCALSVVAVYRVQQFALQKVKIVWEIGHRSGNGIKMILRKKVIGVNFSGLR
jgi:hypothetical protein